MKLELERYSLGGFAKVFCLRDDGLGLTCNAEGVFFGRGVPLLAAVVLPGGRKLFKPRPAGEVAMIFRAAYGEAYDGNPRIGGLRAAANALNDRNLPLAMIATVQMSLPDLADEAAAERVARAERLLKSGYDPNQPRVPAGSPDGGEWSGPGTGGSSSTGTAAPRPVQVADANAGVMSDAGQSSATTDGPRATVPDYRREAVKQPVWEQFVAAVKEQEPDSPTKQYVLSEIFAAEGGTRNDVDRNGVVLASGGITPKALMDAQAKGIPELQGVKSVTDLTIEQRVIVFNSYIDDVLRGVEGKGDALDQIADQHSAAALVDPMIRYGEGTGGTLVRGGINNAIAQLSPEERTRLDINPIPENGRLDQRAFDTFTKLDAEGYGEQVRGTIADQRKARVEAISSPNRQRGELARVDHFR